MTTRQMPSQMESLEQIAAPYWTMTGRSVANTSKTLTKPGQDGRRHYLTSYLVVIDDAAAANDVNVELRDGSTVIWEDVLGSGALRGTRVGVNWGNPGVEISRGGNLSIVVGAGGASVVTVANMSGYTLD